MGGKCPLRFTYLYRLAIKNRWYRPVARPEKPGGGHNVPPCLRYVGLTDLKKLARVPPALPLATSLQIHTSTYVIRFPFFCFQIVGLFIGVSWFGSIAMYCAWVVPEKSYIFNKAGIRVSNEFPIFIIMSPIIKQSRRNKWDRESIFLPTPRIKRKICSIKRPCITDFSGP